MRLFDLSSSLNLTSYGLCDIIVRIAIGTSRGQSTASVQPHFEKCQRVPRVPQQVSWICQGQWLAWNVPTIMQHHVAMIEMKSFQHLCMFQKGLQFSFLCPCASCPKAWKIALGEILSTKIQVECGWLSENKTISVTWRGDEGDVWSQLHYRKRSPIARGIGILLSSLLGLLISHWQALMIRVYLLGYLPWWGFLPQLPLLGPCGEKSLGQRILVFHFCFTICHTSFDLRPVPFQTSHMYQ